MHEMSKTEADALSWVTQTHELALLNAHEHYEFNAVHCLSALVFYICQVAVLHLPGGCPTLNPKYSHLQSRRNASAPGCPCFFCFTLPRQI